MFLHFMLEENKLLHTFLVLTIRNNFWHQYKKKMRPWCLPYITYFTLNNVPLNFGELSLQDNLENYVIYARKVRAAFFVFFFSCFFVAIFFLSEDDKWWFSINGSSLHFFIQPTRLLKRLKWSKNETYHVCEENSASP